MTKDPRVYLAHILECASKIRLYISSGKEAFQGDTMIQDAVMRNFEVIALEHQCTIITVDDVFKQYPAPLLR